MENTAAASTFRRSMAAAFLPNRYGKLELVQPTAADLASPARELRVFWIENGWANSGPTMSLEVGGIWQVREPITGEWHESPLLRQTMNRWQDDQRVMMMLANMASGLGRVNSWEVN